MITSNECWLQWKVSLLLKLCFCHLPGDPFWIPGGLSACGTAPLSIYLHPTTLFPLSHQAHQPHLISALLLLSPIVRSSTALCGGPSPVCLPAPYWTITCLTASPLPNYHLSDHLPLTELFPVWPPVPYRTITCLTTCSLPNHHLSDRLPFTELSPVWLLPLTVLSSV